MRDSGFGYDAAQKLRKLEESYKRVLAQLQNAEHELSLSTADSAAASNSRRWILAASVAKLNAKREQLLRQIGDLEDNID